MPRMVFLTLVSTLLAVVSCAPVRGQSSGNVSYYWYRGIWYACPANPSVARASIAALPRADSDQGWARPTAAPPSSAALPGEPPLAVPAPGRRAAVSESQSFYDAYAVAGATGTSANVERGTAIFWNLTDRDLNVKIDGRSHSVRRSQSAAVNVPREFVWQAEGRDAQVERIAAGESAITIVIRR